VVNATLVRLLRNKVESELLADDTGHKPRTECCCQSVAVIIAAIVPPAGARSIAMMRACLVSGRAAGFDDTGVGRLRGAVLTNFRPVERVAVFGFDLGFVMGSSEVSRGAVRRTTSAPPGKPLGRASS